MKNLKSEISFRTSRSSGPGGQNVNKVSTRVELIFNVKDSEILNYKEKKLILNKLKNKISNDGVLTIAEQNSRSQKKNRENVVKRFYYLIDDALKIPKKRIKTKIPKAIKEKILKQKRYQSEKKQLRSKIKPNQYK